MITYREATPTDAEQIAQLHSLSWQQNYRGIWRDEFLDGPVLENRRKTWHSRLSQPKPNQHIIVAESAGLVCGFSCTYADEDPVYGALLDNLHVQAEQKGQGIGTILIKSAARWVYTKNPQSGFYLWVLKQNTSAQKFYAHLGGVNRELVTHETADGGSSEAYRYVWPDLTKLI
ncbi:GNAT family N-acetyltransferase [Spirosoma foliorum]|uniref:GNAT family N-acetyltransferase n=1 Tax=Spirosoma foliorum TaxID=2710596 RepID=A0A7G5GTK0_9BACT|nr:GNAT family N-acetyltransferase [Spirosoma foliorum]QMW02192.1 GNAT family N-acetyltransferase [Spirosoma foliorum]